MKENRKYTKVEIKIDAKELKDQMFMVSFW
jgi:hypothetical protein